LTLPSQAELTAPTAVGSDDWLGHMVMQSGKLVKPTARQHQQNRPNGNDNRKALQNLKRMTAAESVPKYLLAKNSKYQREDAKELTPPPPRQSDKKIPSNS